MEITIPDLQLNKKKYSLTIEELQKLCRDFQADCYDGFVSNDNSYIQLWLDKNINKND